MSDSGEQQDVGSAKPRGDARWKEHLQAIAQRNDRAKAAGKQERQEREERELAQRRAAELRVDSEFVRTLGSQQTK
ncbi:MAG TPA: hypothetical protein VJU60_02095 [Thermoleophilaceae bacterium]|nr:hypothetical protein [Thermoleophilaceae bacterium]